MTTGEQKTSQHQIKNSDYEDIDKRRVSIDVGAAKFSLEDDTSTDYFYLDAQYSENYGQPKITQKASEGTLTIGFQQESTSGISLTPKSAAPILTFDI